MISTFNEIADLAGVNRIEIPTEVFGLSGQEADLAVKEAMQDEENYKRREAFLAQREIDEINQDNRIFDAQQ